MLQSDFHTRTHEPWVAGGVGGCRNPSFTGSSDDADRCVVVRVSLPGNNLRGVLGEELGGIPTLIDLDISQNALTGPFPDFLTSRNWIRLSLMGNGFYYTDESPTDTSPCAACRSAETEMGDKARAMAQHCKITGGCEGMPPLSCDAFTSGVCDECFFVVETLNPDRCIRCEQSR